MRSLLPFFSALLVAVLAAGCSSQATKTKNSTTVISCLHSIPGATVSTAKSDLDVIAEKAQKGAAAVTLGADSATVVIEASPAAASDTVKQYKVFAAQFGGQVTQSANVVTAWDKTPDSAHKTAVAACV